MKWFKVARDNDIPISGPIMIQKARQLAEKLGVPKGEFKCSNGWLDWFKVRHGISFKKICGSNVVFPFGRIASSNIDKNPSHNHF